MPETPLSNGTYLAFDYGLKRMGVAVGQRVTQSARPLPHLLLKAGKVNWEDIYALLREWQPVGIVVGHPLDRDGATQPMTVAADRFAKALSTRVEIPVYRVDERFTTLEARQQLFESGGYRALSQTSIDSWAAKIILETWFLLD